MGGNSHPTFALAPEAVVEWRLAWPPTAPRPQNLSGESGVCFFGFPCEPDQFLPRDRHFLPGTGMRPSGVLASMPGKETQVQ